MIIVIKKQAENRFIAFVADPKITFISGEHEKNFVPFRNGIVAEGKTWDEAWINIKHQIDRYLNVLRPLVNFRSLLKMEKPL